MEGTNVAWQPDPLPSYSQCFYDIYHSMRHYIRKTNITDYGPADFFRDVYKVGEGRILNYVFVAVILAIGMTILRYILTSAVFEPLGRYLKMQPSNQSKFPESAWKGLYYGTMWSYTVYLLVFTGRYDFFRRPLQIWKDWHVEIPMPTEIYVPYVIQFAFYTHSIYATVFMDKWRRDSLVMIFHHFLTLALIGFSYATRCHKIGMLVLLLHDFEDICLEVTKVNVYLKDRGGKYYRVHDVIATCGFLVFGMSWFVARIYWFPLKVLHSTSYGIVHYSPEGSVPFLLLFNVLLWILQVLNAYWFSFILNFIYRVAMGQLNELDDLREYEVIEKLDSPKSANKLNKVHMNGVVKNHTNGTTRKRTRQD